MVALAIADQEVQVRLSHPRDQFCPFQGKALRPVRFQYHQNAANGLHGPHLPVDGL
ncbi:hypothetical protein D3C85_1912720 [compost metagenome]